MDVDTLCGILKKRMQFISCSTIPSRCSYILSWRKVELLSSRTAPRIKAPPFSDRDIGHSYNNGGEREDMTVLVCKALYKCSGLTILAQETA